jgi:hypothetical protein
MALAVVFRLAFILEGVPMQRSRLAFAIAAAILLTTVPIIAGQRARSVTKPNPARQSTVRVALSPVQQALSRNTVLADTLRVRLPQGTDMLAAAAGFRRLELFVATLHASNNLVIPFVELKRRIVNDGMTLGQAIQDIRPKSRYWSEARRAEDDAASMIRTSEAVVLASERRPLDSPR